MFERPEDGRAVVRTGENSYYSGLYVDAEGVLRVIDPSVTKETFDPMCGCYPPSCLCHTQTFNGEQVHASREAFVARRAELGRGY